MGRAFYRLPPSNAIGDFTSGKRLYHQEYDSYFATIERSSKYDQRRWQTGFEGKETNVDEKQMDFVRGSGNHVRAWRPCVTWARRDYRTCTPRSASN